jgi:diphthamide synthase (EF-2-diphthine--ammonia ligase)
MANNRIWPIGCFQRAGVNQICRLLGISKKTYYYSIDPARTLEQRYGRLKPMLERIIQKNQSYGYHRIKKALFEVYGEAVNHKVFYQWLKGSSFVTAGVILPDNSFICLH